MPTELTDDQLLVRLVLAAIRPQFNERSVRWFSGVLQMANGIGPIKARAIMSTLRGNSDGLPFGYDRAFEQILRDAGITAPLNLRDVGLFEEQLHGIIPDLNARMERINAHFAKTPDIAATQGLTLSEVEDAFVGTKITPGSDDYQRVMAKLQATLAAKAPAAKSP